MAAYQRILLKISGEALKASLHPNSSDFTNQNHDTPALNKTRLAYIAAEIMSVVSQGVQVGIVLGGGNWWRGATAGKRVGLQRITADQIGMLATVMNALAMRDILEAEGLTVHIMSAIPIGDLIEAFEARKAKQYLANGNLVIFSGGTGHPLVSTDSAASLRALEVEADILLKGTTVDGIYSQDPLHYADATLYTQLSYEEVLRNEFAVMDLAAFIQCRDYQLPLRVFNIHTPGNLLNIIQGKSIGTLVSKSSAGSV